uniref:FBA domain-containing protein n=1 Tax=Acrobeloides nanus TaxID=290746 RepID=A0A914DTL1_9BILA
MSSKKSKSKKTISKSKKTFISKPGISKQVLYRAQKMSLNLSDEKLPEFVHFEILLRLNTKELIKNCTLVFKKWNSVLTQPQFWIQKCEYDGRNEALPPVHLRQLPFNYKKICLKTPFGRNLIQAYPNQLKNTRNACRSDKDFGGDPRWIYQQKQGTSKEITIDLLEEGFDEFVLDQLRPTITISEYVAHRADCGARYHMEASLLTKKKEFFQNLPSEMVTRFETRKTFDQWESQKWFKIEHCFKKYPVGVRYILFESEGSDLQGWAGHYGSKMAKPSVVVHYEFNNMPDELKTDAEKHENPCSGIMDVEDRDGNAETSKNKKKL